MKKLLIATTVAATLFAPQAFAQAKNFQGFNLGVNLTSTKTTTTATAISAGGANQDDNGVSTGADLVADYTFAFGPSFTFGVGLSLGTGPNKAGTIVGGDITTKERTSIDFMPGFAVSDSMLIFGKVSALSANAESSLTGINGGSKSISGIGYGIGLRALLSKNLYLQGGYDVNTYNKVTFNLTSLEGKSGELYLGVGYKF